MTGIEPSEAQFQAAVIELAELNGFKTFHVADSRRQAGDKLVGDRQAAGWPDLSMVRDGELVFAELKRKGSYPTPAQRAWLTALERVEVATGHRVRVRLWRPRDWPEIERVLGRRR